MKSKFISKLTIAGILLNSALVICEQKAYAERRIPTNDQADSVQEEFIGVTIQVLDSKNNVDILIGGMKPSPRVETRKVRYGYELSISLPKANYKLITSQLIRIDNELLEKVAIYIKPTKAVLELHTDSRIPPQISPNGKFLQVSLGKQQKKALSISKYNWDGIEVPRVRASAPPVGDIVSGIMYVPNSSNLNIKGPKVTLAAKNLNAITALEDIASRGNHDIVYIKSDPTSTGNISLRTSMYGTSLANSGSSNSSEGSDPSFMVEPNPLGDSESESNTESESSIDSPRLITLNLKDREYSQAFNAVLMAAGLQASYRDGILYVGPDVIKKPIGKRISQTFRLNQVSARSAADFLGNLGAQMTYTNTVTTAVSAGVSQAEATQSGTSATTTESSTSARVLTYGANVGPLLGLSGTTDERLSQVTLVGDPTLISLASEYLRRIDLRNRQVALTIKIYDVDLTNEAELSTQLSYATQSLSNSSPLIFTSDPGDGLAGAVNKPTTSPYRTNEKYETEVEVDGEIQITERIRPSGLYNRGSWENVYVALQALETSSAAKLLASPTVILMEDNSSQATTGDSATNPPNVADLFIGETVVTGLEPVEGAGCKPTTEQVGLEIRTELKKADDNGFITFQINPKLKAPDKQNISQSCNNDIYYTTAERNFSSGQNRVRDGQTLILTGVISDRTSTISSKFPLLGDIPIIGSLFRSTQSERKKKELVITVTPRIIKDDNPDLYGVYIPKTKEIRQGLLSGNAR